MLYYLYRGLLYSFAAWVLGLGFFIHSADKNQIEQNNLASVPVHDAIIVLTGGPNRIKMGADLLAHKKGKRLLISWVNPAVPDQDINKRMDLPKDLVNCCVDLGRQAENTIGNAQETKDWAKEHQFTNLLIVTNSYHSPRSKLLMSRAMPQHKITVIGAPTDLTVSGYLREYHKYLVMLVTSPLNSY